MIEDKTYGKEKYGEEDRECGNGVVREGLIEKVRHEP